AALGQSVLPPSKTVSACATLRDGEKRPTALEKRVRLALHLAAVANDPARQKDVSMEGSTTPEPVTGIGVKTPTAQAAPIPPPVTKPAAASIPSMPTAAPRISTGSFSDLLLQADPAQLPKVCSTCQGRYPEDFLVCPRDATPLTLEGAGADRLVGKVLGDAYQI